MTKSLRRLLARLASTVSHRRRDAELARELASHLTLLEEENIRRGLPAEAARREARRALGNVGRVAEVHREARAFRWMNDATADVRYAIRTLAKSPLATAIVVGSLAVGVGATAAVYGTAEWLLSRPPAGVRDPDRLVTLELNDATRPDRGILGMSMPIYEALRARQDTFTTLTAFGRLPGVIASDAGADQVGFEYVTGTYFETLGVRPAIGRVLGPDDDVDGAPAVAVISHALWQSRFGGDPEILGRPIRLQGASCRVVGVAPEGFEGFSFAWNGIANVWLTMHAPPPLRGVPPDDPRPFVRIIGRLRPDISVAGARERAQMWLPDLPRVRTSSFDATEIVVTPSSERRLYFTERREAESFLGLLLILSGLVTLAACANLANFLIGRNASRRREFAMRATLGASRARLIRQLLIETVVLGVVSGSLGVLAAVAVNGLLAHLPRYYLNLALTNVFSTAGSADGRMAASALALAMATALVFGLLPSLTMAFRDPLRDLRHTGARWTWCGLRITTRQVVTGLQVGLAVALAVSAGLLGRSLQRIWTVDHGYGRADRVLLARIVPGGLSAEDGDVFYEALFERLRAHPGVVSATIGWNPPFMIGGTSIETVGPEPRTIQAGATAAGPQFFTTQEIPVVAGREFLDSEHQLSDGLVVNELLAQRLWPSGGALGQPVLYGPSRQETRVVGVVRHPNCTDVLTIEACMWQAFPRGRSSGYLRVRTVGNPAVFVPELRRTVGDLNPDVAVAEETPLEAFIDDLTAKQQLAAGAGIALATFGALLAAVGCLSLFLSMVRDSLREIAIRIALGAGNRRLTMRVLQQALPLLAVGVLLGVLVASVAAWMMTDFLYQTDPQDAATFIVMPAAVFVMVIIAVAYSAWVATRVPPAAVLRGE